MNNLRYALRTLRKSRGFTVGALLSLAFGIGVNTTTFSIINAVLLRPLPVDRPAEIVEIYTSTGSEDFPQSVFSYPDYVDLRDNNDVFSDVAAHAVAVASLRQGDDEPATVFAEVFSADFFDVMGVAPMLGRTSFAGAAAFLLLIAFVANYVPARRAARVDPLVALRSN